LRGPLLSPSRPWPHRVAIQTRAQEAFVLEYAAFLHGAAAGPNRPSPALVIDGGGDATRLASYVCVFLPFVAPHTDRNLGNPSPDSPLRHVR